MNYLKKVDKIIYLLSEQDEEIFITQLRNAKLMGGNGGEILAIICSVLKTYEIQKPELFSTISEPAKDLYAYAESLGLRTFANFDLLEELSR